MCGDCPPVARPDNLKAMDDVLIIGGGVIGLSLAWDLAKHGQRVHVVEQGAPGREASWAGAGMIPAASRSASQHPFEQLRGLACEVQPVWAAELKALTGIDNGYRRCGALHLARTPGEAAALAGWAELLRAEGVEIERLSAADLSEIEPGLARHQTTKPIAAAFLVSAEAQIRNPRHLQALVAACQKTGAKITAQAAVTDVVASGSRIVEVQTSDGPLRAGKYCFTAGAWTGLLLKRLGISAGILPIRGQMVLFECPKAPISRIVNEGSRYVVPRDDGRVLAGSTEEEVGFDKRTTEETIAELTDFARGLVPALGEATIERTWAGLRPGSFDGLPYLGPLPGLKNGFVAAGHFRSGLYLSAPTAVLMSQLLRGQQPRIDLACFRVGR
jgi:glycine oxidase